MQKTLATGKTASVPVTGMVVTVGTAMAKSVVMSSTRCIEGHLSFVVGDGLRCEEGEAEQHDQERPELRHQEVPGVELEQVADPDDRDQELPDDDALEAADDAEPDAGEQLGERGLEHDLQVENALGGAEGLAHLHQ